MQQTNAECSARSFDLLLSAVLWMLNLQRGISDNRVSGCYLIIVSETTNLTKSLVRCLTCLSRFVYVKFRKVFVNNKHCRYISLLLCRISIVSIVLYCDNILLTLKLCDLKINNPQLRAQWLELWLNVAW